MAWGRALSLTVILCPQSVGVCERPSPALSYYLPSVWGLDGRPVPPNLLSSMPWHCLCDSCEIKEVDNTHPSSQHLLSCPQVSTVLLAVKPGQPPPYFPAAAQQCEQQTPEVSSPRGSKLCPVQAARGLGQNDRKIGVSGVEPEPHLHPSTPGREPVLICFKSVFLSFALTHWLIHSTVIY